MLDATSGLHGDKGQVMPICMGCKLDGLGFSYTGLVSCTFLAVTCPLFQRQITECVYDNWTWERGVVVVDYQTSILHVFHNYLY